MQLSHHHALVRGPKSIERRRRERGYVLVTFAMLLVPLLLMVGLSVDVGSWYNRASNIQKAADAGALAGVVWLPDTATAGTYARAAASRNGFTHGVDGVTVTITPTSDTRLRVTITDTSVESPFAGNLGIKKPVIERKGTAEYVLPVPLGSPENRFGNNPTSSPPYQPNLWASISAPYTAYSNGDPYSTKCTPTGGSGTGCTQTNPEYRDYGYLYVVDVPPAMVGQTLDVKLYDAGNYERPDYPTVETADRGEVNTMFEMYRPDSTPLDIFDGLTPTYSLQGNCTRGPGRRKIANEARPDLYKNQWRRLCKINVTAPGQYVIQVKSSAIPGITDSGDGWNQFSLQAEGSGSTQPTLFTTGDLSLFNNLPGLSGNQQSTFYLAKIDPIHKGKTLIVSLFDPGDGAGGNYYVNLLGAGGSNVGCQYKERGASSFTTLNTCRIQTRSNGSNIYNGKWLDIQVSIPNNYTCSTDCWWKVRYDFYDLPDGGSGPNDRTVWAARVIGDPVHLIEE
jgi:Flp pilus assembly protein TadG